jgi:5-methylcytosine-specific restriction endonuclease McrA
VPLQRLYERDGGVCQLGNHAISLAEATRDHIVALGDGGSHKASNVQLACRPCNEAKGSVVDKGPAVLGADRA